MNFSYRTRRFFGRLLRTVLILAAVAVVVLSCWMLWLQRYIIYTPDGVRLDFSLPQTWPSGVVAKPIVPAPSVNIDYGQEKPGETQPGGEQVMQKIAGYYVTVEELMADPNGTLDKIRTLPEGSAILLEVKNGWGYFYYPTTVSPHLSGSFNMTVMGYFMETVNDLGLHTIARLPALRDYEFGLANTRCGLWAPGGYLWADGAGCYWLDPTQEGTLTWLIRQVKELQAMGFDEVVFRDFTFPPTEDGIVFQGDRSAALTQAAQTLVTACASGSFTLSFMVEGTLFQLPDSNCRLYLENVAAENVVDMGTIYNVADPATQLLFFANTGDTRYEESCVLRPIDMAY